MKYFFGRINGKILERIKTKKIEKDICLLEVAPICKTLICEDCIRVKISMIKNIKKRKSLKKKR